MLAVDVAIEEAGPGQSDRYVDIAAKENRGEAGLVVNEAGDGEKTGESDRRAIGEALACRMRSAKELVACVADQIKHGEMKRAEKVFFFFVQGANVLQQILSLRGIDDATADLQRNVYANGIFRVGLRMGFVFTVKSRRWEEVAVRVAEAVGRPGE